MKKFENPELVVEKLDVFDVITTSPNPGPGTGGGGLPIV